MLVQTKLIDVFYRLRHTSESVFDARTLRPQQFSSHQRENSRERGSEIQFEEDGRIRSTNYKSGGETASLDFRSENLTLDPISAAFVARSLPVDQAREISFDVFNGKHRYLISFVVEGREQVAVGKKTYDAFRVVPSVQKLTDTEGEKRLQSAKIWVSADDSREVLKLESKVMIGKVSAKLAKFTPRSAQPSASAEFLPEKVAGLSANQMLGRTALH